MDIAWDRISFILPLARWLEEHTPHIPQYDPILHPQSSYGDTYISAWYLEPEQHVFEFMVSVLILIPIFLAFQNSISGILSSIVKTHDIKWPSNGPTQLWGMLCLIVLLVQIPFKLDIDGHMNNPVFIFQPCHILLISFIICSFIGTSSSLSVLILHSSSLLIWGPTIAILFPAVPTTLIEQIIFWTEHVLLVFSPVFTAYNGVPVLSEYWVWNWFPFVVIVAYHWWVLAPLGILSGVNVATMMVPPPILAPLGPYYRLVQIVLCMILHKCSVEAHRMLFIVVNHIHKDSIEYALVKKKMV